MAGCRRALAVLAVLALAGPWRCTTRRPAPCFSSFFPAFPASDGRGQLSVLHRPGTLAELARGTLVHRFSLGRGRLCPHRRPAGGAMPWLGVYGVGAVAAWLPPSCCLACVQISQGGCGARRRWRCWSLIRGGCPMGDAVRSRTAVAAGCGLAAGQYPPGRKIPAGHRRRRRAALVWRALLRCSRALVVVAPETALPLLPRQLAAGLLGRAAGALCHGQ
jgi:apolipoprotein N-acyltransferase